MSTLQEVKAFQKRDRQKRKAGRTPVRHEYHVTWEIDVYADSPEGAAREAMRIQRAQRSMATVFDVTCGADDVGDTVRVDLCADPVTVTPL